MGSGGYKIRNQAKIHFLSFATVGWIDVFTRSCYCDIIVENLNYCIANKNLVVYAWIIMSNHLHLIVSANEGYELSAIIRDFKKHTSITIINAIKTNIHESRKVWLLKLIREAGSNNKRNFINQFWQQDNRPIELSTNDMLDTRLDYLHQNPVKAGLVDKADNWVYSSATDYFGEKGLVKIMIIN